MSPKRYRERPVGRVGGAILGRAAALTGLWWVLTEGALAPAATAVFVPVALLTAFVLDRQHRRALRAAGLLRFVPFFLWESLRGGVDVARRALDPRMPLAPSLFEYPLRLSDARERVLLASVLSLVPGTASAELGKDCIRLHVLDVRLPIERIVGDAEAAVAGLFGDALEAPKGGRESRP